MKTLRNLGLAVLIVCAGAHAVQKKGHDFPAPKPYTPPTSGGTVTPPPPPPPPSLPSTQPATRPSTPRQVSPGQALPISAPLYGAP